MRRARPAPPYRLDHEDIRAFGLGLCPFCGGYHLGLCRRVVEVEYHPDGRVKHAVLLDAWDESRTTYPWQLEEGEG